jgi:hypothetical protein
VGARGQVLGVSALGRCRPGPGPLPSGRAWSQHQRARPPQRPVEICWSPRRALWALPGLPAPLGLERADKNAPLAPYGRQRPGKTPGPHSAEPSIPDKDEVPGSSPDRPTPALTSGNDDRRVRNWLGGHVRGQDLLVTSPGHEAGGLEPHNARPPDRGARPGGRLTSGCLAVASTVVTSVSSLAPRRRRRAWKPPPASIAASRVFRT